MKLLFDEIETPIGTMTLVVDDTGVRALEFDHDPEKMRAHLEPHLGKIELERRANPGGYSDAVRSYFEGDLHAIDAIPADPAGTPFQRSVWSQLREIPVGATRSYADLARAVGRPTATRAVGAANGRNPVAVIVPCHRVIGADGTLTGYGGGLKRKRWLLEHEGARLRFLD
jgi:methylated-DNA-[protein]-cysteine S-methyltransferase